MNLAVAKMILAGDQLTERQLQILTLLSEGGTYRTIGKEMFLSPDTVRAEALRASKKLGAKTRTHAVALAIRLGLIP